jgi:hypothetical protein
LERKAAGAFFAWWFLCQFSRNIEALPGELRRRSDGRPPYSTSVVPADVFLFFRMKSTLKAKFQDIVGIKKNVTSELNPVPFVVLDDVKFAVPCILVHQSLQYSNQMHIIYIYIYTHTHTHTHTHIHIHTYIHIHTGCSRRNVRDFGRVFLRSNYTDITKNTYIQS